jgi:hypothetical protein
MYNVQNHDSYDTVGVVQTRPDWEDQKWYISPPPPPRATCLARTSPEETRYSLTAAITAPTRITNSGNIHET